MEALEPATAFWLSDMPEPLREAPGEAEQILDGDWPVASRVDDGDFCWRASRDDVAARLEVHHWPAWPAIACAGGGAGYGGISALRRLCWTDRVPAQQVIANVAGAQRLALSGVTYAPASTNMARRELTWAETTLLEALLTVDMLDAAVAPESRNGNNAGDAWAAIVPLLADGESMRRLGGGAVVRLDVLDDVASTETSGVDALRARIRDVTAVLGRRAEHPTAVRIVNYAAPHPHGDPFRIPVGAP